MGKELEYKLQVPDAQVLERILEDPRIKEVSYGELESTPMRTTYYDSEERRFGLRHWTLRHRREGDTSVVCVKTPTKESHTRGEWQIHGDSISEDAILQLISLGAPAELLFLYGTGDVAPICGAEFLRRHRMLRFPDGSQAELACDEGRLLGKSESMPLCEVELELYKGSSEEMLRLVSYLCQTYGLQEQPKSKLARARSLK